jgi:hypothetical protein
VVTKQAIFTKSVYIAGHPVQNGQRSEMATTRPYGWQTLRPQSSQSAN